MQTFKTVGTMEITTVSHCSIMCTFCPQITLKKAYGNNEKIMSLNSFTKFLSKIPSNIDIHFSGYAEPWLNPEATNMFELSLLNNHNVAIFTTLQGMTINDAKKVIELCEKYEKQIKMITLHLQDKNKNMLGFKMTEEYKEVLKLFIDFKNKNLLKDFEIMTMDKNNNFDQEILEIINQPTYKFKAISRAGNLKGEKTEYVVPANHSEPIYCGKGPYYNQNVLMPNGDVALCCMDYGLQHVIGNLHDQEYWDLFESKGMQEVRKNNMLNEYSDKTICRNCEWAMPLKDFISPIKHF
jgi:radical SAM protein with 4Fe4S-binding SPASM domain